MTKHPRPSLILKTRSRCHSRRAVANGSVWRRLTVALLAGCVTASAPAEITVTGSYAPSDESYWTGGGGTKNGTIGGSGDGTLTVEGGSVLNLKNAYFGSGAAGGNTGTVTLTGGGSQIIISRDFNLGNDHGTGIMTMPGPPPQERSSTRR